MAKVEMQLPDDFMARLNKLDERMDEILPKVLQAGADVVYPKVRANLQASIGSGLSSESRSTGTLLNVLGISPPDNKYGSWNIKVGFSGGTGDGSPSHLALQIEYGRGRGKRAKKKGMVIAQPPKPFVKPAANATRKAVTQAMIQTMESEVGK